MLDLTKYFPELTDTQVDQYNQLGPLYADWNAKINVISRKDIDELMTRHVLHSLGIARVLKFNNGSDILDIGTGGGFPGIPLAIMFPEVNFTLVDSIGKKIMVVNEIASALNLSNVKGIHARAEKITGRFDFVVSRAVTRIKPFYQWTKGKFKTKSTHSLKNGILYLKGGDLTEEMAELSLPYKEHLLADHFEEDFFESKKVIYVGIPGLKA